MVRVTAQRGEGDKRADDGGKIALVNGLAGVATAEKKKMAGGREVLFFLQNPKEMSTQKPLNASITP